MAFKDKKGTRTAGRSEMKKICYQGDNNLYMSKINVQPRKIEIPVLDVLPEETEAAVKVRKNGKSPGKGNS